VVYQTEKLLRDLGDKAPADIRQEIESKVKAVKDAMASNDLGRIRNATDDLQQASYKLSEILYRQTAGAPAGGEQQPKQTPEGGEDEGVIDAEYKKTE
jgi:molecular chaperone DnaK